MGEAALEDDEIFAFPGFGEDDESEGERVATSEGDAMLRLNARALSVSYH